jgi:hypothetical protein
MANTNYISSIVRIIENPVQTFFNKTTSLTTFRVQLPQIRNNIIINLGFWGNLGEDVGKYYQLNDYILIEGYLSLRDKESTTSIFKKSKKIEITVLKVYPIFLSYNHESTLR